jgi:hypothetical protein
MKLFYSNEPTRIGMTLYENEVLAGEFYVLLNPDGSLTDIANNRIYHRVGGIYVWNDSIQQTWSQACARETWYLSVSAKRTLVRIVENPFEDYK